MTAHSAIDDLTIMGVLERLVRISRQADLFESEAEQWRAIVGERLDSSKWRLHHRNSQC